MTTRLRVGSRFLVAAAFLSWSFAAAAGEPAPAVLGVKDIGIFPDLDGQVQLPLPAPLDPALVTGVIDPERAVLVLYLRDWPVKVYPLGGPAALQVGDRALALRAADRRELLPLLRPGALRSAAPALGDRDRDGI